MSSNQRNGVVPDDQARKLSTEPQVTTQHDILEKTPLKLQLSRDQLIGTFIIIWIMQFALAFSQGIFRALVPYVTSSFEKHALTATTSVIANIASGIFRLPYAKLLDVWGRPESMTLMVILTTLGSVIMAACKNVETYCIAQVLYNVGYYGIQFSLIIFITDVTRMQNRAILMGLISTPSMAAIWAYGPATEAILESIGFRWAYGIWSILIPVLCAPLLVLLFHFDRIALRARYLPKASKRSSIKDLVLFWLVKFDVLGLLILATGLSFTLLALSIYSYQPDGWTSPLILSLITIGPVLIAGFVLYEKYLAPTTFLPWQLMADRTVIFTNLMAATLYTSEFACSAYIYSMLIVVFKQSVAQATYINNIYMVGASFWNMLLGVAFRYNGRIKYYALAMGIPFFILGQGLMICFSPSYTPVTLMVVCQIFIAFGGGTMYPIEQLSLMTVSREHTPALLAVESVIVDSGKAAGSAIATSIWTSMFETRLAKYLPESEQKHLMDIYGSLVSQVSHNPGSPARLAIDRAYLETQRVIFIAATSLLACSWASVLFWKDMDVKKGPESTEIQRRDTVLG